MDVFVLIHSTSVKKYEPVRRGDSKGSVCFLFLMEILFYLFIIANFNFNIIIRIKALNMLASN